MSPRPAVVLAEGTSGGRNSSPAGGGGGTGRAGSPARPRPPSRLLCAASTAGPAPKACARTTPARGIRPPRREPYARARGLNAEEVARLLEAIPEDSAAELRLRALVLAYLLTGRRRSEVLNLRWRDLDMEGGWDPS
ncbi:MAG TPA: tyrosine-type recombinase/integrase [Candidatus Dormibacteraeota bacterium]